MVRDGEKRTARTRLNELPRPPRARIVRMRVGNDLFRRNPVEHLEALRGLDECVDRAWPFQIAEMSG